MGPAALAAAVESGGGEDPTGGGRLELDAFCLGGQLERVTRRLLPQPVDGREAEQPSAYDLAAPVGAGKLRQSGAGERQRQLALGDLMQRGTGSDPKYTVLPQRERSARIGTRATTRPPGS
jgi:hypothetical protein